MTTHLPERKQLPHEVPNWVPDGETYFITINCKKRGTNQLAKPSIFKKIEESSSHYSERSIWHVRLLMVMPDHIHGLLTLNTREKSISTIIGGWKRYIAKTTAIQWQMNYFEHRIRTSNELTEKEQYILNNPARKNLCEEQSDWPFVIRNQT